EPERERRRSPGVGPRHRRPPRVRYPRRAGLRRSERADAPRYPRASRSLRARPRPELLLLSAERRAEGAHRAPRADRSPRGGARARDRDVPPEPPGAPRVDPRPQARGNEGGGLGPPRPCRPLSTLLFRDGELRRRGERARGPGVLAGSAVPVRRSRPAPALGHDPRGHAP